MPTDPIFTSKEFREQEARRTERERKYLSKQIDATVEGHLTDELLGRLVKQALNLRYYGSDMNYLSSLINREVKRHAQQLIADWLKDNDDQLIDAIAARLHEAHVPEMAVAITDEFINDITKGTR